MEEGAFLTRGPFGAIDIDGGYFTMNGGEIRECGGAPDTITLYGDGARFQKNRGGIIRGKTGEGANNPDFNVIGVWSKNLSVYCYRNTTVGQGETLELWISIEGDIYSNINDKWDGPP